MEVSIIVNEDDEVIDYKERSSIRDEDIYRVAALLVKNSNGEFLLAQRSLQKVKGPGVWSFTAAGTVEKGESYDENIVKEAEEEIGVKGIEMTKIFKKRTSWHYNFFCQFYMAKMDVGIDHFTLQKEEVERVRWFSAEEIRKGAFEGNRFSENLITYLDDFDEL